MAMVDVNGNSLTAHS